jgi:hypothetical protein
MIVVAKFTEQDILDLRALLDAGVKAMGLNAVHSASRIAQVLQSAVDEARAESNKNAQQSLFPNTGIDAVVGNGAVN